jgi:succinate dehydrogenase / fumarate reductase cytochrome b subunit
MPLLKFLRSTIGQKILMGATGLGLFGFIVIHMLGNLQIFAGSDTLNAYAKFLKTSNEVLWGFRLALLGMVAVHILVAINLTRLNRAARPQGYGQQKLVKASGASRYMIVSGLVVLAFIVFHLLHFTVKSIDPTYDTFFDDQGRHDVYRMVLTGFSNPWISGFYVLSVGLLAWHLSHGVMSLFRSLGLENSFYAQWQERAAKIFSVIIFVGMSAVPLAVLFKLVK